MADGLFADRLRAITSPEGLVVREGPASTLLCWWPVPDSPFEPASADLTIRERHRVASLPLRAAAVHETARAGARTLLAALLDTDPRRLVLRRARCPLCGARNHGPPEVTTPWAPAPVRIAMTHTSGAVLLAVSTKHRPGVDAENPRHSLAPPPDAMLRLLSAPEEAARITPVGYLRAWTRKEALAKGMGAGLGIPLPTLRVRPECDGPLVIHVPPGNWPGVWRLDDLSCPLPGAEGTVAALATPLPGHLEAPQNHLRPAQETRAARAAPNE